MALGAYSLRPVLSSCTRCLQPHLWPIAYTQPVVRTFHQPSRTNSSEAEEQRSTVTYALPRTKIYEYTRPQPRAPVKHRQTAQQFEVNDSQTVLDEMYWKLLGPQGVDILTPELRWQAVTHASFDHGRQPYNNKLAFLGRRILFLHATLHILNQARSPSATRETSSKSEPPETISSDSATYLAPIPFEHPDYKNLDAATYEAVGEYSSEDSLAEFASAAGLHRVMRWKPMNPWNLVQSGIDTVAVECVHAIIGAIALSRGGLEAKKFVTRLLEQRKLSM